MFPSTTVARDSSCTWMWLECPTIVPAAMKKLSPDCFAHSVPSCRTAQLCHQLTEHFYLWWVLVRRNSVKQSLWQRDQDQVWRNASGWKAGLQQTTSGSWDSICSKMDKNSDEWSFQNPINCFKMAKCFPLTCFSLLPVFVLASCLLVSNAVNIQNCPRI